MSMPKAQLRTHFLHRRAALDPAGRSRMSRNVHANLRGLHIWRQAREVLLYAAVRGEVDTDALLHELLERGVRALYPRCDLSRPRAMEWAAVTGPEDFTAGAFRIPEPHPERCPACTPRPDLILVPGAAFDRTGGRLGYGGGYYDAFLPTRPPDCRAVGLAFAFQLIDRLPADPWDCPLDCIVTDHEVVWPA